MAPWRVVLAVVALGIVTPAVADPIPEGLAEQSVMLGQNQMAAFTYRPAQCPQPSLLLLFHGNGGAHPQRWTGPRRWIELGQKNPFTPNDGRG